MDSEVILEFLLPRSLATENDCIKVFELINGTAPHLLPVKYDQYEPLKKTVNKKTLSEMAKDWSLWDMTFWEGKKPKSEGAYLSNVNPNYRFHDILCITSKRNHNVAKDFVNLLVTFTEEFDSTFSYIATPYTKDFDVLEYYGNSVMPYTQGLKARHLKEGLPDGLAWVMFFGKEYVELFGKDKLLTAPVFETRAHSDGVYVQLTENITDPLENYESYMELKKAFMDHVGADAFLSIDNPSPRLPDLSLR